VEDSLFVDYVRLVCQKWELFSFDIWNIISADYKQKLFPPDKNRFMNCEKF